MQQTECSVRAPASKPQTSNLSSPSANPEKHTQCMSGDEEQPSGQAISPKGLTPDVTLALPCSHQSSYHKPSGSLLRLCHVAGTPECNDLFGSLLGRTSYYFSGVGFGISIAGWSNQLLGGLVELLRPIGIRGLDGLVGRT
ncbi:hypothetical protein KC19_2G044000 [Ceratodon purpureus]|uniref:Uncharacterized protein n=1 Tax=Ceratodon purpureus TaxID=3225 RepID=A0A8T0ISV8_CERPU|nr:hypothetical protein KC19_2G044000 [Ceratodon purpureus]